MQKKFVIALILTLGMHAAQAQEASKEAPFKGEAEAGAVVVSGNTKSESYATKGKATYVQDMNVYTLSGRYIETKANGIQSAKSWELGARYERSLSDYFGVFIGHKAQGDSFAGFIQRDSSDVGGKYFFIKDDDRSWSGELGYRYSKTYDVNHNSTHDQLGRLYSEYNQTVNPTLSFKYWAEYLPNFTETDGYQANTEASFNVMLTQVFSLKMAYLLQYQNQPAAGAEYTDTTSTMTLVAKF
jgi:putative salt-induced outer membrane protein